MRLLSILALSILSMAGTICAEVPSLAPASRTQPYRHHSPEDIATFVRSTPFLTMRGGARKKAGRTASLSKTLTGKRKVGGEKKKEAGLSVEVVMNKFNDLAPITKSYFGFVVGITLLGALAGDERCQAWFALDPLRTLYGKQIWRFATAASCLGKMGINWALDGYHLIEYGSQLEKEYGSPQFLLFFMSQVVLLSIFSMLSMQPFFCSPMITSMLYVLSRIDPTRMVKWLVIPIPMCGLPLGLMAADVLQAKSGMAAIPHIIGMLSGHFYHFHKNIWPKTGGEDWLIAPNFFVEMLDADSASKSASKESVNKALKNRKRGKGKKLGGR